MKAGNTPSWSLCVLKTQNVLSPLCDFSWETRTDMYSTDAPLVTGKQNYSTLALLKSQCFYWSYFQEHWWVKESCVPFSPKWGETLWVFRGIPDLVCASLPRPCMVCFLPWSYKSSVLLVRGRSHTTLILQGLMNSIQMKRRVNLHSYVSSRGQHASGALHCFHFSLQTRNMESTFILCIENLHEHCDSIL